jgi:hypothetical protein
MKTSLKSKIQLAAYQMFRDWSFYASKIHTEIDFTIWYYHEFSEKILT